MAHLCDLSLKHICDSFLWLKSVTALWSTSVTYVCNFFVTHSRTLHSPYSNSTPTWLWVVWAESELSPSWVQVEFEECPRTPVRLYLDSSVKQNSTDCCVLGIFLAYSNHSLSPFPAYSEVFTPPDLVGLCSDTLLCDTTVWLISVTQLCDSAVTLFCDFMVTVLCGSPL